MTKIAHSFKDLGNLDANDKSNNRNRNFDPKRDLLTCSNRIMDYLYCCLF